MEPPKNVAERVRALLMELGPNDKLNVVQIAERTGLLARLGVLEEIAGKLLRQKEEQWERSQPVVGSAITPPPSAEVAQGTPSNSPTAIITLYQIILENVLFYPKRGVSYGLKFNSVALSPEAVCKGNSHTYLSYKLSEWKEKGYNPASLPFWYTALRSMTGTTRDKFVDIMNSNLQQARDQADGCVHTVQGYVTGTKISSSPLSLFRQKYLVTHALVDGDSLTTSLVHRPPSGRERLDELADRDPGLVSALFMAKRPEEVVSAFGGETTLAFTKLGAGGFTFNLFPPVYRGWSIEGSDFEKPGLCYTISRVAH